jgi:dolichol-phosphate mannosyltransferase
MEKFLTIILPTFNEKDNVIPLLEQINLALDGVDFEYEILFIDDSNDETPEIISKQTSRFSRIRMIHRAKEERTGLATAFIRGFEDARGKYILCMDSDLQHPPNIIPLLAQEAKTDNADIVVATRYAKGGSAEGLGSLKTPYGIYRRAVSLGMKYLTQIIFIQTRKTSDPLGGFFLFKKGLLENIQLKPQGFKILVEILMRTSHKKVSEVPYTFLARENDDSKATLKQGLEYFKHVWYIIKTVPEAARFLKFCIVGGSGVIVNLGTLYALVEFFHLGETVSWTIAVILSIMSNFILNNLFTYSDKKSESHKESVRRLTYYYIISMGVMVVNYSIYHLGRSMGFHYILSAFIGIIVATSLNFLLTTKFVWKLGSEEIKI